MSPIKQKIAIAEACGWAWLMYNARPVLFDADFWAKHPETKKHQITAEELADSYQLEIGMGGLPDYLNDLNAMHEAEKFLTSTDLGWKYIEVLKKVTFELPWCATARQRAEAFLKTLDLWTS